MFKDTFDNPEGVLTQQIHERVTNSGHTWFRLDNNATPMITRYSHVISSHSDRLALASVSASDVRLIAVINYRNGNSTGLCGPMCRQSADGKTRYMFGYNNTTKQWQFRKRYISVFNNTVEEPLLVVPEAAPATGLYKVIFRVKGDKIRGWVKNKATGLWLNSAGEWQVDKVKVLDYVDASPLVGELFGIYCTNCYDPEGIVFEKYRALAI